MSSSIKTDIKNLTNNPESTINSLSHSRLSELFNYITDKYHNDEPIISDELYDVIKDLIDIKYPHDPTFNYVGYKTKSTSSNKVKLPYWMGSMDKVKTSEEILKFIKDYKGEYVLSDKLDGVSALLNYDKGELNLYTRGDGEVGQNISHLITNLGLNDLTTKCFKDIDSGIGAIRGELLISKSNFEKIKDLGKNARNMVSGLVNAKHPDPQKVKYLDFVAYEIIEPKMKSSEQFSNLKKCGFKLSENKNIKNISYDELANYFYKRKEECPYEMDGIIVTDNHIYPTTKSGNPKNSFAFKTLIQENTAIVTVINVEWNASKHGLLKPIVKYTPVELGGVLLKNVSGYNYKYINDNKIGPGSKIKIVRSGDVIPKIIEFIKASDSGKPQLPDVTYELTETGVDIKLIKKDEDDVYESEEEDNNKQDFNKDMNIKIILNFFVKIGTVGLAEGTVKRLYEDGFDSVKKILHMKKEDFLKIDGFKEKSSEKMINNIKESIKNITGVNVMTGSNLFEGLGSKKLILIIDKYPDITFDNKYLNKKKELTKNINEIAGFQELSTNKFINSLENYYDFLEELPKEIKSKLMNDIKEEKEKVENNDGIFKDMTIVFTGVRDKELEKKIEDNSGVIGSGVNKKTSALIVKEKNSGSSKEESAKKLNIPIYTIDEFKEKYNI
jgi:NAD-dependent DNA ligase